ncbi:MAG: acyl-ACP--UDP-N-acetylglucosamine O-acyltransferase [Rhodospirillales bacterium]|nr:acyl-ACP--UDP-N-acetylglucosamine O-acyltransferase [Rhodospirillales bacterium]
MSHIHPSAVVDPAAQIADGCTIGPFCVVGPDAVLGAGCILHSHVAVAGRTTLGETCQVYPFASLGHAPQDLKYADEPSRLEIGKGCVIREHVTLNPGTEGGGMLTKVGEGCLLMVGAHVAHDCILGNRVILANNATLAGHVTIGDGAVLGGLCAVQQFVRIGCNAMIGGMAGIRQDVVPFALVSGRPGYLVGLNMVGLRRASTDRGEIEALRKLFDFVFDRQAGTLSERLGEAEEPADNGVLVANFLEFLRGDAAHGFLQPSERDGH